MSKRTITGESRPNAGICAVLRRYLRQGTNLGVAIPVLVGHIAAAKRAEPFGVLTEKEIQQGFRQLSAKYFKSEYHPTYLNRAQDRFLEKSANRYKLRGALLDGATISDLDHLVDRVPAGCVRRETGGHKEA